LQVGIFSFNARGVIMTAKKLAYGGAH